MFSHLLFDFNFAAVQHERGPRNSTIRRQVAMYLKETSELSATMAAHAAAFRPPYLPGMVGMPAPPPPPPSEGVQVSPVDPARLPAGLVCHPTPKVPIHVHTKRM